MTRRWSLRTRFVLTALACLLPLVGVSLYVLFQGLEHSSDQLEDAEEAVAEVVATGLARTLEENENVLGSLAGNDALTGLNREGTEELFADARFLRPNLLGLFLVGADGEVVTTTLLDPSQIRQDFDPILNRALTGETGISGRLSIGANEVIAIIVPVWPKGANVDPTAGQTDTGAATPETVAQPADPIGAVGALLSVERLNSTFTPYANEQTEIAIVGSDQVIASSLSTEGDSLAARLDEPIALAIGGASGSYEYDDAEGHKRLAVYTPVDFDAAEWAVVVSAPSPRTYQPNQGLLRQGLIALALAVLVTLVLALAFGDAAARPLRQLTAQATALAEGDFTQRIAPTGGGEVRTLSIAFRDMEDRLATQVRDLEDTRRERERQADELRDLNRRTVRLQEEERRRIAADIHDAVSPLITGALYQNRALRIANGDTEPADRDSGLDAVSDLLERAGSELHGVIFALRPPDLDDIGVVAAIERYMASIQRHGLTCHLDVASEPLGLSPDARLGIYRIVQEALHNVVRHAGADECLVRIESSPVMLRVVVRDNGSGFDPERAQGPTSLGILSMRERAAGIGATVEIASKPGGGTVVVIERPTPGAVLSASESDAVAEAEDESMATTEAVSVSAAEIEATAAAPRRAGRRARSGRSSRATANGGTGRTATGNGGQRVAVVTGDDPLSAEPSGATAAPEGGVP